MSGNPDTAPGEVHRLGRDRHLHSLAAAAASSFAWLGRALRRRRHRVHAAAGATRPRVAPAAAAPAGAVGRCPLPRGLAKQHVGGSSYRAAPVRTQHAHARQRSDAQSGSWSSQRRAARCFARQTHRRSALRAAKHGAAMRGASTRLAGMWCGVPVTASSKGPLRDDVSTGIDCRLPRSAAMDPFIQGLDEEAAARVRGWVEVRETGGRERSRLSGGGCAGLKRVPTLPTPLPGQQDAHVAVYRARAAVPGACSAWRPRRRRSGGAARSGSAHSPAWALAPKHTLPAPPPDPLVPLRRPPAACRRRLRGRRHPTR